jgi:hypothetical protein
MGLLGNQLRLFYILNQSIFHCDIAKPFPTVVGNMWSIGYRQYTIGFVFRTKQTGLNVVQWLSDIFFAILFTRVISY